jgi:hypothetical protein
MAEEEKISKESILFYQLVLTFHTSAWQNMGKVVNPLSGKVEKDLNTASYSIDMLDMMKNRMKGNLSEEEERFLTRTLGELKLNYLDELNRQKSEEKTSGESQNEKPK